MAIAKFVTAKDIHRMLNEVNPECRFSYQQACKLKNIVVELHEKDFGQIQLFDEKRIPLSWVEHYFSEEALTPKKKKKKVT